MFLSTFAFIEHRFGAEAKDVVMRRLGEPDRALLSDIVLPIPWYPLAPFGRLLRTMDGALGRGDFSLITERGEWTATRDMKTLRKVLLKMVSIPWIIQKGATLWPQFHDSGRWDVKELDGQRANATLYELAVLDDAICASLKGWIIGLSSLAGQRADVQHSICRTKGADGCVFEVSWGK